MIKKRNIKLFGFLIFIIVTSCEKQTDNLNNKNEQVIDSSLYTFIPDRAFERALIEYEYDDTIDGMVITENIKSLNIIELSNRQIKDLTGIEDFLELKTLICDFNQLTSLDISNQKKLIKLDCWDNELTSLDVSANNELKELICGKNLITSINIDNNILLTRLVLEKNQFTEVKLSENQNLLEIWIGNNELYNLDVSKNTKLVKLACNYNNLVTIDLSKNKDLRLLSCSYNDLTSLDISINSSLFELYCNYNKLLYLNVKNGINKVMTKFDAQYNNLSCIEVDDTTWAMENWKYKVDSLVDFNTECN